MWCCFCCLLFVARCLVLLSYVCCLLCALLRLLCGVSLCVGCCLSFAGLSFGGCCLLFLFVRRLLCWRLLFGVWFVVPRWLVYVFVWCLLFVCGPFVVGCCRVPLFGVCCVLSIFAFDV